VRDESDGMPMDQTLTAIRDFISSREPGVTSFLTTVNRYGDAYVR